MHRMYRPLHVAVALAVALTAAACGSAGASTPSAANGATGSSATPAPHKAAAQPAIATPAVAPPPTDSAAVARFGQAGVERGYQELVDLATRLAFNKDFFLDDGNNSSADLDPVLAGRTDTNQTDYVKKQATACMNSDSKACADVVAFAFFDFGGGPGHTLTYRADGQFVSEQSITAPTVSLENLQGQDALKLTFLHTAKVRLMLDGKPITVNAARDLTYDLWPAEPGNATRWWIVNWHVNYHPTITDETTGQPYTG